ncbi:creatininase family protein [Fertoebacter nigrum]|uniref:Creatininase family protein n=1 Tax=Fertoeibacter niger TaxID=2656921 RepID=A0A8X8KPF0_9RHOB|nr:creatininase family protein [Fertoeibacter niger]NUB45995.1 creatininase family protein [Fertoeibacter niger]
MRRFDWADYRANEFAGLDPMRTIAILPTAAIEQHGPHLPLGTDTLIAEGMLARLRADCPEDLDIRILPVQAVGKSNEHLWAPGTLTLAAETALAAWVEIGLSVARAGLRKIVIVNSHGGNLDLCSILSRELRVRAGMLAVKCQWTSFGVPEGLHTPHEMAFGIHGGDMETSLMLHFRPETVDMTAARNFASSAETAPISPIGPVSYGWIASDLNPAGVVGNAAAGTAEKGRATAAHQVAGFIALLRQVQAMPLDGFDAA